jgi:hypothetical protein
MHITKIFSDIMINKSGTGSIRAICHCGRTHYSQNNDNYDEGEYEELQKLHDEDPDKYIIHFSYEEAIVHCRHFNGCDYVLDCPCKWEERAAKFIWEEREIIIQMLTKCRDVTITDALEIDKLMESSSSLLTVK